MKKHTLLAAALTLPVAAPALAQYSSQYAHSDWTYSEPQDFMHYRPFHFQIEGGPSIPQNAGATNLDNGWNGGAGLTWYPTSAWPYLGFRVDGSYSRFNLKQPLLNQQAAKLGTNVDDGNMARWGGDVDAELDLPLGSRARLYLLGGIGWYKSQFTFRQNQSTAATICSWWGCAPGFVNSEAVIARQTGVWQNSQNGGVGVEFALAQGATFFVDARYVRIGPSSAKYDVIPIRFGLRF